MATYFTLHYALEERAINQRIFTEFIKVIYCIRYFIGLLTLKYLTKNLFLD